MIPPLTGAIRARGTRRRVPLWDNARWIAITLVVIGHAILPLIAASDTAYAVYLFIYTFHVPVFVGVSGYFAKAGVPGARQMKRIVSDIVLPYIVFETIWTVIHWLVGGEFRLDYATASWTLWFLLALGIWRIALPYLVMLRYPLIISIVIAVGAGYLSEVDSTFALSRTLGFLPFFVFGWKLRQWQITGRWLALRPAATWRWRAGAVALFIAVAVAASVFVETWRDVKLRRFLLYDESFSELGYHEWWAGLIRLALIALGFLLTLAFLVLMPRHTTWFSRFGQATMYIYLLHTFFLYPFRETGMLAGELGGVSTWVLVAMIAYSIAVSVLLAQPFVRRIFRPLVEPRARWLYRRDASLSPPPRPNP
ncbi:acyltransferase family protein [Compostimonas suwonensis]|uniref:Fucose 4-O-acetylase-like acetyltransferase n=1 Tax=Compostimonas suwonensis TaxID=1048394 RepID=A0A2M9BUN1_9MICO|nr:acyltransferase family protein [Compostimonas suwonensis]PJJ61640.1 fucose 4-O-acetylase-like acetyltransferase [Compostimonas suwonensis]